MNVRLRPIELAYANRLVDQVDKSVLAAVSALRSFAGPLPQVSFCPTGGVGLHNIGDYLALPTVLTVGGSWLTPAARIEAGDWDGIRQLAAEAAQTVSELRAQA